MTPSGDVAQTMTQENVLKSLQMIFMSLFCDDVKREGLTSEMDALRAAPTTAVDRSPVLLIHSDLEHCCMTE